MGKPKVIKIIGVDASTRNIGWAVVTYHRENLIASGQISLKAEFYQRIHDGPRRLLLDTINWIKEDTAVLVIEHSFFTKNPDVGRKITMMVGACICVLKGLIPHIKELSPNEIKLAFTGDGKADKEKIKKAVAARFGLEGIGADEADAIAIACSYIKLHKRGYFKKKKAEKAEKDAARARRRAASKAVKTRKPLAGELQL